MKSLLNRYLFSITVAATSMLCSRSLMALPFNDDMVDNPMKTGRVMRPSAKDSIPYGSLSYKIFSRDEALKLTNPQKGDPLSIANGERLFAVNCAPCHGDISSVPYKPGTVSKFVPGPNLSADMYREKPSDPKNGEGRTDGSIYGTIHFGSLSTIMPALGWKFSPSEHWDMVNYIRKVQQSVK